MPLPSTAEFVLVPREPTPEMIKAARSVPEPVKPYPPHFHLIWDAMLAAVPVAQLVEAGMQKSDTVYLTSPVPSEDLPPAPPEDPQPTTETP